MLAWNTTANASVALLSMVCSCQKATVHSLALGIRAKFVVEMISSQSTKTLRFLLSTTLIYQTTFTWDATLRAEMAGPWHGGKISSVRPV